MKVSDRDFDDLAVYAMRYGLGRQTYSPFVITKILTKYISKVSDQTLAVMQHDINKCTNFGADIDQDNWQGFHKTLIKEIDKRATAKLAEEMEE